MHFLYLLMLCYTSVLLTPVNPYVVLAGNLNDFRSLAKKYVPKNLVGQIKAILENGIKYYEEPSNDYEQVDGNVEYFDKSQQDDSYEVTREFKKKQQPVNRYQVKSAPKVALAEPSSPIATLGTPIVLTIDDIVEKVKQRLFQQIFDKSVNAQANSQARPAQSDLEPQQILMQQTSLVMNPQLDHHQQHHHDNIHQSTIMKQLVLMQQQIEQLYRSVQQKKIKNKRPNSPNIEAVEVNFKIVPNPTADVQKTNDGNEFEVEPSREEADESVLSEETTIAPVVTETRNKVLTDSGTVENEQFTEENEVVQDSVGTPEEIKESVSNEEEDNKPDTETVKGIDTKLGANVKVHTQEFGNPDAGEPIVEKTYNFDKPNLEAGREPVNLKLPVDSARKVMLF